MTGEDGYFGSNFPRPTAMRTTTLAGVFSLAVLADNDPVKVAGFAVAKRRLCTREYPDRPDVGVLLKGLADCQPKLPEGDVVRNVYNGLARTPIFFFLLEKR